LKIRQKQFILEKMRYRIGRALRLIIGLAFLVFMVPFLMSKLDSSNNRSTTGDKEVDYPDVRIKKNSFSLIIFWNI
jgi:hypothetical protein